MKHRILNGGEVRFLSDSRTEKWNYGISDKSKFIDYVLETKRNYDLWVVYHGIINKHIEYTVRLWLSEELGNQYSKL